MTQQRPHHYWQPLQVDAVIALLAEGLSRTEIGERLDISRGAVSGLVGRLEKAGKLPKDRPRPVRSIPASAPKERAARRRTPYRPINDLPDEPPSAAAAVLTELSDAGCTWPIAGAGLDTLFCGRTRAVSSSYCLCHAERAYRFLAVAVRALVGPTRVGRRPRGTRIRGGAPASLG